MPEDGEVLDAGTSSPTAPDAAPSGAADDDPDEAGPVPLSPAMVTVLERAEVGVVATADAHGECDSSLRTGPPGFVRRLDEHRVAYPEYRGNGVMASLGNIEDNPHLGLMLIDFAHDREQLHLSGTAELISDTDLRSAHPDLPVETVKGRRTDVWVVLCVEHAELADAGGMPALAPVERPRAWGTDDVARKGGDFFGAKSEHEHETAAPDGAADPDGSGSDEAGSGEAAEPAAHPEEPDEPGEPTPVPAPRAAPGPTLPPPLPAPAGPPAPIAPGVPTAPFRRVETAEPTGPSAPTGPLRTARPGDRPGAVRTADAAPSRERRAVMVGVLRSPLLTAGLAVLVVLLLVGLVAALAAGPSAAPVATPAAAVTPPGPTGPPTFYGRVVDVPSAGRVVVDTQGQQVPVTVLGVDAAGIPRCAAADALSFARRTLDDKMVTVVPDPTIATDGAGAERQAYIVLPDQLSYTDALLMAGWAQPAGTALYRPTFDAEARQAEKDGVGMFGPPCRPD